MAHFRLEFSLDAAGTLAGLDRMDPQKLKKVKRALGRLQIDPRHPGLHTHVYRGDRGPNGEKVLQSYVENRTAGAWRIWWFYGPDETTITIKGIGPHPD